MRRRELEEEREEDEEGVEDEEVGLERERKMGLWREKIGRCCLGLKR